MTKKCKSCNTKLPAARVKLNYSTCVECSSVEAYGFVNVIVHKTGNSVQPLPKSQADAINKIGDRKRFGTILKGGSKNSSYNPKNTKFGCSTVFVGSEGMFEQIGSEAMKIYDNRGKDAVLLFIEKSVRNCDISPRQANQLKLIVNNLI